MSDPASASDGRQVLVVGDGLGGLSAAAFLRQRGLDPTVVGGPGEDGVAGRCITLWHTGVELLAELEVRAERTPSAVGIEAWLPSTGDGAVLDRLETGHGRDHPFLAVDRAPLRRALREHLPTNSIRVTKTPRTLRTDDGPLVVEFEDGVRERFDLVVGADGTDSWVRSAGFDAPEPTPWGTTTWTFRTDREPGTAGTVAELWCSDGMLAVVGGPSGTCGRFVTTVGDPQAAAAVLAGAFEAADHPVLDGLVPPGQDALEGSADRVLRADPWVTDRVALLGDAAHSLPPGLTLGPSLAVEDAYVLAEEVAGGNPPAAALGRYQDRRRGRLRRLDRRAAAGGGVRRRPLAIEGLPDLREARFALLRSSFARHPDGTTGPLDGRL
ncbi:MAG: NAD(P)/FAD-dependent oxidoreductase [Haloarculaceae archaeon]